MYDGVVSCWADATVRRKFRCKERRQRQGKGRPWSTPTTAARMVRAIGGIAGPYDVVCDVRDMQQKLSWAQQRVQLGAPAMPAVSVVGTMGVGWAS